MTRYILDEPPPAWLEATEAALYQQVLTPYQMDAAMLLLRGLEADDLPAPEVSSIEVCNRRVAKLLWRRGPRLVWAGPVCLFGRMHARLRLMDRGEVVCDIMPAQPVAWLRGRLGWVYGEGQG